MKATNPSPLTYVATILLLTLAYYVTGRLGLLLAIPPGYATVVWPPSGVALAGILLLGYRCWPGVLLGSFSVNLFLSGEINSISFMIAAIIAGGAALQAVLSAALVRRFMTLPNALETARDIGVLLFWGGPVGCLINATIGTTTLSVINDFTADQYAYHWLTWWVGDGIGVLVFTPILLLLFMQKEVSAGRKWVVTGTLIITFAITIYAFFMVSAFERQRHQLQVNYNASELAIRLKKDMVTYTGILTAIERFISSSEYVSSDEFDTFTRTYVERMPGLYALSWNRKVTDAERDAFVQEIREQGHPDFLIKDRVSDGKLDPSPRRDIYFPVTYTIPFENNKKAHGFDTYAPDEMSNNIRITTLDAARDTIAAQSTSRIRIVQQDQKYGLLIYYPVYKNGNAGNTLKAHRENLEGYVAGVFLISNMVEASLGNIEETGLEFRLRDISAEPENQLLYDSRTQDNKEDDTLPPPHPEAATWKSTMDFAGRSWEFYFQESEDLVNAHQNWTLWAVLKGGVLFSGLLSAFLLVVSGRTDVVQRLVQERTREVTEARTRLQLILDSAGEGIFGLNTKGYTTFANKAAEDMVGYKIEEMEDALQHTLIHHHYSDGSEYPREDCNIYVAMREGKVHTEDAEVFWRKDGSAFSVEYTCTPIIAEGGKTTGAVVVFRDITERKRAQQRLAETYKELESFTYIASHDLRSPLINLRGFSQRLEKLGKELSTLLAPIMESLEGKDKTRLQDIQEVDIPKALGFINKAVDRMEVMTNAILQLSRTGRQALTMEELDTQSLAENLVGVLEHQLSEKNATIIVGELPKVIADRPVLEQIFSNILDNAIKYLDPERDGKIIVSGRMRGEETEFCVQDNGRGISENDREKVFAIFRRASNVDEVVGDGMGMAHVRSMVTRHGGHIWFESELGKGSAFYFTIAHDIKGEEQTLPSKG